MASQTLQTIIAINAKVGNGFSEVGATLSELGSLVNGMSQKLIDFGKESVEVYRDYEKSMKDAEVALSTTYGRNTKELSQVMDNLNTSATEWAATTIFHTNDVANAISEAAHAGWDYQQIMSGIPAAMQLAQAGSMDLSEAVDYIVKSTNAAGLGFEDIDTFIDHWAYAANTSATTIDEMGAAMLRMGGTMKFAENTDEILTMLAVLADTGYVGESAGTLLRNAMIRLVAPTKNAKEAMADLGATSDEAAEALGDEELAAANARLAAHGFSLYDEDGNMKSMLDTYRDLYVALGEIAGGYENIEKNKDVEAILGKIFPQRSITGALALLEAASDGYGGLYDALQGGEAEGYGEYAATTMMDSLNGRIETFESKVERLKQVVGESISDELSEALGNLGEMVDSVAEMDTGNLDALVSAAEVIAMAGPGLLVAGGAFRFLGAVLSPVGALGVGAITLAAIATYIGKIEDANFEDAFGDANLDTSELTSALEEIRTSFNDTYADVEKFEEQMTSSFDTYMKKAQEFKEFIMGKGITGSELTDKEKNNLYDTGEEMVNSIEEGAAFSTAGMISSLTETFGGAEEAENNTIFNQIKSLLVEGYEEDVATAQQLGQKLRDAMTAAFADSTLTPQEIANIQGIFDQMNEIVAQEMEAQNYANQQRILRKSQTLGLDAIYEGIDMAIAERDLEVDEVADQQNKIYSRTSQLWDKRIKNGYLVRDQQGYGYHKANEEDKQRILDSLKQQQQTELGNVSKESNQLALNTMEVGISGSTAAKAWEGMQMLADEFRGANGVLTQAARNKYFDEWRDTQNEGDAVRYLVEGMERLGGREAMQSQADYFYGKGNIDAAKQYQQLVDMYDLFSTGDLVETGTIGEATNTASDMDVLKQILTGSGYSMEQLAGYAETFGENTPDWAGFFQGGDAYAQLSNAALEYGYGNVENLLSTALANLGTQQAQPAAESAPPEPTTIATNTFGLTGIDAQTALEAQGVSVSVDGDTQELEATIEAQNARQLLEYVDGDASDLQMKITDEDGRTITVNVAGNAAQLDQILNSYQNKTITVNMTARQLFAHGGRATEPSTFGEAGPEWAIPEEHSERTAQLLNAAREASGFSWPDLLERYGGLNADVTSKPIVLNYSPTINAGDVNGVEEALQTDKDRLNRWFEEKQLRDRMEVYA